VRRVFDKSRSFMPMTEIQGIARIKIHDGKLDEFKRVSAQCMDLVRTKDTGTVQYELYLNEDQNECVVLERYRDSESLLQHMKNIGGLMQDMLNTSTISGEICGAASPELIKALDGTPVRLFSPYQAL
jgi:quinol monooxygenase YgiN